MLQATIAHAHKHFPIHICTLEDRFLQWTRYLNVRFTRLKSYLILHNVQRDTGSNNVKYYGFVF